MSKTAIFPGSFDPFTIGHKSIVQRALPLFDKLIIGIGYSSSKKSFFPIDKRKQWIENIFKDEPKIEVQTYQGLTVDFCKTNDANYIVRGIRNFTDFDYEQLIAQMNKNLNPSLETVFLLTLPEHSSVTSTVVRDIIIHGGNADMFLPVEIDWKNHIQL